MRTIGFIPAEKPKKQTTAAKAAEKKATEAVEKAADGDASDGDAS